MKKLIGYLAVLTILTSCTSQKMLSIYQTRAVLKLLKIRQALIY
ncbi:hypothetical protein [Gilliamella sp. Fer1-1]|nr:hypothetical protein [Gilliamella apicola]